MSFGHSLIWNLTISIWWPFGFQLVCYNVRNIVGLLFTYDFGKSIQKLISTQQHIR